MIMINGVVYGLTKLYPDPRLAERAWRLRRPDDYGNPIEYDVSVNSQWGHSCTCGDFVYVKETGGGACKHITNLVEDGLL